MAKKEKVKGLMSNLLRNEWRSGSTSFNCCREVGAPGFMKSKIRVNIDAVGWFSSICIFGQSVGLGQRKQDDLWSIPESAWFASK